MAESWVGKEGTGGEEEGNGDVPIAHLVDQFGTRLDVHDVPVVVGQQIPTPPTVNAFAVSRPVSARTPVMTTTGTWNVPGNQNRGGGSGGGGGGGGTARPASYAGVNGGGKGRGGVGAVDDANRKMSHTGTWNVPGCGTAFGTGGRRFAEERAGGTAGSMSSSSSLHVSRSDTWGKGKAAGAGKGGGGSAAAMVGDGEFVADGGPVLVACGQGQSMYDVKGFMSSWVLVNRGGKNGGAGRGEKSKIAAAGGDADSVVDEPQLAGHSPSWALRSEVSPAGEGGFMCSACVPSVASGQVLQPRMLITGGKDNVLREWEVENGCSRLVAELIGHTDWISCCALLPSTTAGMPPSVAVSGGRDGSVRFWSKSATSSAAAAAPAGYSFYDSYSEKSPYSEPNYGRAPVSSGFGRSGGGGGGGGGGGIGVGGRGIVGTAGWSMTSSQSGAHGASEFVTCAACPGGTAGALGGWVATGGSDWSVRLWDVAKSRELGRLSFRGHNHPVRSLAASSDGKLIVSGGEDHKVIVWSPKGRSPIATLKGHAGAVNSVAIDPGTHSGEPPRWVASGGGEGFLLVWDPRNWKEPVATLRGDMMEGSSSLLGKFSGVFPGEDGSLRGGAGARFRGESGRWEGDTTGATMLNSVNYLAAGGAESEGEWLFGAGEKVVRAWRRRNGMWTGGLELPGDGMGGVSSLSVLE